MQRARTAKSKLTKRLSGDGNVVGIGLARVKGKIGVKVNLRELRVGDRAVPRSVDDVPVRTEIVGRIRSRRARA
ncbi:MAG TPA: hypothetical protein VJ890_21030 [Vineibacter sp.]|nr:hypothetical protein [Vineibacter sp.]